MEAANALVGRLGAGHNGQKGAKITRSHTPRGNRDWREKQRARCKVSLFHTATVSEHTALIDDRETWSNAQSSDRLD